MIESIDNFFNYIFTVGFLKLVRVFWFFVFFEFIWFFLFDLVVLIIWKLNEKKRMRKLHEGRRRLFIERLLVSIIVLGKNEGKHIYKLIISLKEQSYHN